jgi:hypothetical protein
MALLVVLNALRLLRPAGEVATRPAD